MKLNRELISTESVPKTPVEGGEELNPLPSVFASVLWWGTKIFDLVTTDVKVAPETCTKKR